MRPSDEDFLYRLDFSTDPTHMAICCGANAAPDWPREVGRRICPDSQF